MRGHNDWIELFIRAKRFILLVFYWQLMCLSRVCILRRGPVLLGGFRFLNGAFGDCCCFTFSSEEFHPSSVNTGQTPASLSCCPQPVPTPVLASWWFFGWWSLRKPAEKIPSALPSVHLMVTSAQREEGPPKRASGAVTSAVLSGPSRGPWGGSWHRYFSPSRFLWEHFQSRGRLHMMRVSHMFHVALSAEPFRPQYNFDSIAWMLKS